MGKLLGPRGNSLKRLQEDTLTKMSILGKGSMRDKEKVFFSPYYQCFSFRPLIRVYEAGACVSVPSFTALSHCLRCHGWEAFWTISTASVVFLHAAPLIESIDCCWCPPPTWKDGYNVIKKCQPQHSVSQREKEHKRQRGEIYCLIGLGLLTKNRLVLQVFHSTDFGCSSNSEAFFYLKWSFCTI